METADFLFLSCLVNQTRHHLYLQKRLLVGKLLERHRSSHLELTLHYKELAYRVAIHCYMVQLDFNLSLKGLR